MAFREAGRSGCAGLCKDAGLRKGSRKAESGKSQKGDYIMQYRNVFAEIGKSGEEVQARLKEVVHSFFYGEDRVYFEAGEDMAYMEDTGNHDARTEGMSYGMMMCVQLDMKEEFDRLWKWAKTYMWMEDGWNEGYFIFQVPHRISPAAVLPFVQAGPQDLPRLRRIAENSLAVAPALGCEKQRNKQILFVPGIDFTDPSYHLPHFYELFAKWADEEDRSFWAEAAEASRKYLAAACHPETGMSAEYAEFERLDAKNIAIAKNSSPSGAGPSAFLSPVTLHDQAKYPSFQPSSIHI